MALRKKKTPRCCEANDAVIIVERQQTVHYEVTGYYGPETQVEVSEGSVEDESEDETTLACALCHEPLTDREGDPIELEDGWEVTTPPRKAPFAKTEDEWVRAVGMALRPYDGLDHEIVDDHLRDLWKAWHDAPTSTGSALAWPIISALCQVTGVRVR